MGRGAKAAGFSRADMWHEMAHDQEATKKRKRTEAKETRPGEKKATEQARRGRRKGRTAKAEEVGEIGSAKCSISPNAARRRRTSSRKRSGKEEIELRT